MGAKTTAYATSMLASYFNGTSITGISQNITSSPNTVLWLSLHTADPGNSGNQTTNEAAYTGYARQSVARTSSGFSVASAVATLVSNLTFPTATGGSEVETFVGVGLSQTGTGTLDYHLALSGVITVISGVAPVLVSGTSVVDEN